MPGRLIIDGNAVYEIDEDCVNYQQGKKVSSQCLKGRNGRKKDMTCLQKEAGKAGNEKK